MWWWCKIRRCVIAKEMAIHLERAWKFSSNFILSLRHLFIHSNRGPHCGSILNLRQSLKSLGNTVENRKISGIHPLGTNFMVVEILQSVHKNGGPISVLTLQSLRIFCFYWIFFFLTIFSTVRTYVVMFSWPWLSIIFLSTTTSVSTLSLWLCWFFIRTALLFLGMNLYSSGRIKMSPSGGLGMSE